MRFIGLASDNYHDVIPPVKNHLHSMTTIISYRYRPEYFRTLDNLNMELLMEPKTEYLLDASLGSLHVESQGWLREIDFWGDEMSFFYKLLKRNGAAKDFPEAKLAAIEKELVSINSDKIGKLRREIQAHEQLLAKMLKTASLLDEESYRETHRKLLMDIYSIHLVIRSFKKEVFSFIQQYD